MKLKKSTQTMMAILISLMMFLNSNAVQPQGEGRVKETISALQSKIPGMMRQVDVPGLAIAVVRDTHIVWSEGFGITDYESQQKVTPNTIFEAGSLSKPVFAYAVLKLVDEGLLDLDKSLSSYLPMNYIIDERIDEVTARMVLSHSSGFPLWWPEGEDLKIHFTPGKKFSYSSEAFVYLQNVVETITEKSLPVFMNEYVFEPLNMTNSSFVWEDRFERQAAFGHNPFGQEEPPWKRFRGNAASSLLTTAADYEKFLQAILNGQGLEAETFETMFRPHTKVNLNCIECVHQEEENLSEFLAWAPGWGLYLGDKERRLWHWGDNMNHTGFCILSSPESIQIDSLRDQSSPRPKLAMVYFANSSNGLTLANEIVGGFFGDIHPILDWLHYDDYDSPGMTFRQTVLKEGAEKGLDTYFQLKRSSNDTNFIRENTINEIGYILLTIDRIPEAVDIFRLNVEEHPDSWNVYDSLAEAYAAQGDIQRAINYYRIALAKVDEESHKKRIQQILRDLQD